MPATRPLLPEPTFVDVDGATAATYVLPPRRSQPVGDVVICHGTPWSAQVWADVAHHLRRDHQVFLWDMPGYGRSAKGHGVAVDLATQMVRFATLLDRWRLEAPHVVAHDIGGAVALGAHLLHDREYASMFLWDVVTLEPWGSPFFRLVAEHADVFAALPADLHAALVETYVAGAARHELDHDVIAMLREPWVGETGQPAFYQQIAQLQVEDTRPVAERLSQVRCPAALGWGEQDPWIPLEQAARLQRLLPGGAASTVLGGVGHLAPLEAPAEVERVLDEWLASVTTAGDGVRGARESSSAPGSSSPADRW